MAKYKETVVDLGTANSWVRSDKVSISNPFRKDATIVFSEQTIVESNGNIISISNTGSITEKLTEENANTVFNLVDIDTNLPTGSTMTYLDVKQAIQSLYMHLALERDAGNI